MVPQNQHGRVIEVDSNRLRLTLRNEKGVFHHSLASKTSAQLGDLVEITPRLKEGGSSRLIEEGTSRVLTSNGTAERTLKWMHRILDPRRLHGINVRNQVESGIQEFFKGRGFLETRTPLLVPCPGMETHIRPFRAKGCNPETATDTQIFLPTSPEFAMKRLLVGGLEKIFQICPAFRDEPLSTMHRPEFTILEWYRAYATYEDIMTDTEELFESIALKISGKSSLLFQGQEISVKTPWPRLQVRDLFSELVDIDLVASSTRELLAKDCARLGLKFKDQDDWDDLYFNIWLNLIEPKLPKDQAVFVKRYPASQAALSVVETDPDGSQWARRFEVYAGGLELGNAFEELTDPIEQRRRFEEEMELREKAYGREFPKNPMDEEFLEALSEGMPPSGGIAVGVDRMIMLFADEGDIQFTRWLAS